MLLAEDVDSSTGCPALRKRGKSYCSSLRSSSTSKLPPSSCLAPTGNGSPCHWTLYRSLRRRGLTNLRIVSPGHIARTSFEGCSELYVGNSVDGLTLSYQPRTRPKLRARNTGGDRLTIPRQLHIKRDRRCAWSGLTVYLHAETLRYNVTRRTISPLLVFCTLRDGLLKVVRDSKCTGQHRSAGGVTGLAEWRHNDDRGTERA